MKIEHKFVQYIPDHLEAGVLYISIEFCTVVHKCMCGCGNEVVTPLSRTDWKITFNGESVSLYPSIGNWGFDCQSHYWITRNKIKFAEKWSLKKIKANRERDKSFKSKFFNDEDDSE